MDKIVIEIIATESSDADLHIDEVKRKLSEGFTSGLGSNEFGSYNFEVTKLNNLKPANCDMTYEELAEYAFKYKCHGGIELCEHLSRKAGIELTLADAQMVDKILDELLEVEEPDNSGAPSNID